MFSIERNAAKKHVGRSVRFIVKAKAQALKASESPSIHNTVEEDLLAWLSMPVFDHPTMY